VGLCNAMHARQKACARRKISCCKHANLRLRDRIIQGALLLPGSITFNQFVVRKEELSAPQFCDHTPLLDSLQAVRTAREAVREHVVARTHPLLSREPIDTVGMSASEKKTSPPFVSRVQACMHASISPLVACAQLGWTGDARRQATRLPAT
jgi:hypothetical protein